MAMKNVIMPKKNKLMTSGDTAGQTAIKNAELRPDLAVAIRS